MASTYTTLVGAPPSAITKDWLPWYRELLNLRVAYSDVPRLTTYYISQSSGSDSNAGTIDLPFQTIAKAQAIYGAGTSDMSFLFKRGDEWNETTGLTFTKVRCTIGAYGTGVEPLFNRFTLKYNQSGWTVASGNRYTRAETNDVAWVRNQNNRLGNTYTRVSSTSLVASTPLSFFWSANVLHVNAGAGINPNSVNLEAVISNAVNGILMSGDGSMSEDIELHGWGISRTNTATQTHAYTSNTSGTDSVVFRRMKGYFGSSHVATHLLSGGGNSGGIATFIDCKAGYTSYNSAGESVFNSYSNDGGQETIFHNCEMTYGTLPSDDWYGGSNVQKLRGQALYAHTSAQATKISLIIAYGMTVKANAWGGEVGILGFGSLPDASSITDVRGFCMNEVIEENNGVGFSLQVTPTNMVRMNGAYYLKPVDYSVGTLTTGDGVNDIQLSGWGINNLIQVDLTNIVNGVFSLYNKQQAMTPRYWNNHIYWKKGGSNLVVMDFNTYNGNQDFSSGGELKNNIIASDGTGTIYVGFCNDSTNTTRRTNNAYYSMTSAVGNQKGYDQHLNKVALSALPIPLREAYFNSQIYQTGTDLDMAYDIRYTPRSTSLPSIGPIDEPFYSTGINFHTVFPTVLNQSTPRFVFNEYVGTGDASTKSFFLRNTPVYLTPRIYVGALRQVLNVDYTMSGSTITFINIPPNGQEIVADYYY